MNVYVNLKSTEILAVQKQEKIFIVLEYSKLSKVQYTFSIETKH